VLLRNGDEVLQPRSDRVAELGAAGDLLRLYRMARRERLEEQEHWLEHREVDELLLLAIARWQWQQFLHTETDSTRRVSNLLCCTTLAGHEPRATCTPNPARVRVACG